MSTTCFVYEVKIPCAVRSQPDISEDFIVPNKYIFQPGDLVSVNLIRDNDEEYGELSSCGPFLRLSDGSGWLFERKFSEILLERRRVENGLWPFYADNFPVGIGLRTQPIDDFEIAGVSFLANPEVTFFPMQSMVCDRKVVGGDKVNYYRVKGTSGWVFDRRGNTTMLLDEKQIQKGLFAYKALFDIGVRPTSTVDMKNDKSISEIVRKGEIVAVDFIRESPYKYGNGPFLHLSDGSGWLFEKKHGEKVMESVSIEEGSWSLRVVGNFGMALRLHPTTREFQTPASAIYFKDDVCLCDRKVVSPNGVTTFYRVQGKNGWIFDKTEDGPTGTVMTFLSPPDLVSTSGASSIVTSVHAGNIITNIHDVYKNNLIEDRRRVERIKRRNEEKRSSLSNLSLNIENHDSSSIAASTITREQLVKITNEKYYIDHKLRTLRNGEGMKS